MVKASRLPNTTRYSSPAAERAVIALGSKPRSSPVRTAATSRIALPKSIWKPVAVSGRGGRTARWLE